MSEKGSGFVCDEVRIRVRRDSNDFFRSFDLQRSPLGISNETKQILEGKRCREAVDGCFPTKGVLRGKRRSNLFHFRGLLEDC